MIEFNIRLNIDSAIIFSKKASKYEFDIDILQGRYIINGKSTLGIFSLNICKELKVVLHSDEKHANDFIKSIAKYIESEITIK